MVTWELKFTKRALKDAKKLSSAGYKQKAQDLLDLIKEDPLKTPPRYEELSYDFAGAYSRRINIAHRLVYEIDWDANVVKVLCMFGHYDD